MDEKDFDIPTAVESIQPIVTHRRDKAFLVSMTGPNQGNPVEIRGAVTLIGRQQGAGIQIEDPGVSRRHAELHLGREGQISIRDLGSRNGTFLNGTKILESPLHDGDKIRIGRTTLFKFSFQDWIDQSFQRQLFDSVVRDGLTKAFNRRYLVERLGSEFAYAERHQTQLGLVLFDIDHFKTVNDRYGHVAGDQVLSHLAVTTDHVIRREDVFARCGGEEFAVLCRGIPAYNVQSFSERLRQRVAQTLFAAAGATIPITISLGAAMRPSGMANPDHLMKLADQALYEAKNAGRNCVRMADSHLQ